jgi:serine/threonine-protein kinase
MAGHARWQRVQQLLDEALSLPPDRVPSFLADACAGDAELQHEAERLYAACQSAGDFLVEPPADLVSALLADSPGSAQRPIGPYTLIREIGRGGMGAVWLAERADVQKRVALKLVSGGLHSPARVQRFLLERRVLARLEHPNIARLLDAGIAPDGTPWLAMEYVEGERIDRWCEQRQLSTRARLALFEQVCNAVAYAHRNLVVHRDLKPSNILVTAEGEPRLVDFGIAKLLAAGEDTDPVTVADARPMTPEYASPEQLRGDTITTASDVYQLGVLLHQLLTGQRPAATGTASPVVRGSADPDIANIVRMAMHAEAHRRYESAAQLRDDVRRYLEGKPIVARAPALGYRARKFVARHKAGTAMAATVALLVLGSVVLALVQAQRVAHERDRAEQVSTLLQDLFASSDPTVAAGDTITVRAVLERGAQRVRSDSLLDPLVRARLLYVIAVAYSNLGIIDQAIQLQREGVAALEDAVRPDHPDLLRSRGALGTKLAEAGQVQEALPMLEAVLAFERKQGTTRQQNLAHALHDVAWAHQLNQQPDSARLLYEEALAIYRNLPADSAPRMTTTLVNLGALARSRNDLESAESLYREALERRRARLGSEHPITANTMTALASILVGRGQLDEAEPLANHALAVHRRTLPDPHVDLAADIGLRADLLAARGKLAEAETSQREALAMYRALYGAAHVTIAHATADLGSLAQRQGRLDEAALLQREAADRYIALAGERNLPSAIALQNLAYTEFLRRRLPESEALYRRAVPVLDSLFKASASNASTFADFATVLAQQRKCDQAEPYARRSYELARTRWPENSVDVIRPQRILGQCLVVLQRYAEAEPLLLDAHRKLLAGWGAANTFTKGAAHDLVQLYERWGKKSEADRFRVSA